ncbi:S-adenosylmethionine synthase [Anopheles sinensis]|uniref:S-adenosylmethionine synthase n=1 Tax=Anopheles sinensis TaxID=74873 RepID=A0A084VZQ2_ANOSI|nr:S-adenosylmethionine synthase [Anopheles sinensis]
MGTTQKKLLYSNEESSPVQNDADTIGAGGEFGQYGWLTCAFADFLPYPMSSCGVLG